MIFSVVSWFWEQLDTWFVNCWEWQCWMWTAPFPIMGWLERSKPCDRRDIRRLQCFCQGVGEDSQTYKSAGARYRSRNVISCGGVRVGSLDTKKKRKKMLSPPLIQSTFTWLKAIAYTSNWDLKMLTSKEEVWWPCLCSTVLGQIASQRSGAN